MGGFICDYTLTPTALGVGDVKGGDNTRADEVGDKVCGRSPCSVD